ncbi:unnamed protein product (macronuclear) [Paramecium tetraurelia]|uniref:Uncharacterized protein n=1 Tax=Paramecium tetraurelia TaxID=5888 RepID=A0D5A2_PARTE|nr:uncharacterized protein GSPATT00013667001 [Paramecium tetraurelia]CAK78219.1 unnamed protein product [Paramecium tetraurelia]|eukprot:XP_001445616.1 hypothetical protein (macronuclear) [Paramecium tetraurelia strain d4-2]
MSHTSRPMPRRSRHTQKPTNLIELLHSKRVLVNSSNGFLLTSTISNSTVP